MSGERSIASRYAVALFELANEGSDFSADLVKLSDIASNDDAKALLLNTQIAATDRARIALKAAGISDKHMLSLVTMLCSRNKATLLPLISEILAGFIREQNASLMVDVTVAIDLSAELATKLKDSISTGLGSQVELNVHSDASILGGMILNIGDRQIDHSVRGRLDGMKRALSV